MAYILTDETGRITAASFEFYCGKDEIEVEIPDGIELSSIHDYLYSEGEFIHDPPPEPEPIEPEPTAEDMLNAMLGVTSYE